MEKHIRDKCMCLKNLLEEEPISWCKHANLRRQCHLGGVLETLKETNDFINIVIITFDLEKCFQEI